MVNIRLQRYGIFLNNQTFLSLFSKLNWLFLLIIEIFSYICTRYEKRRSYKQYKSIGIEDAAPQQYFASFMVLVPEATTIEALIGTC